MVTAAMPFKPVASKPMAAKPMAAKPVASVKTMSAEAEEDARPIAIIARIITIVMIGIGGSNIAARPIASAVAVADEAHGVRILTCVGLLHPSAVGEFGDSGAADADVAKAIAKTPAKPRDR